MRYRLHWGEDVLASLEEVQQHEPDYERAYEIPIELVVRLERVWYELGVVQDLIEKLAWEQQQARPKPVGQVPKTLWQVATKTRWIHQFRAENGEVLYELSADARNPTSISWYPERPFKGEIQYWLNKGDGFVRQK